MSVQSTSRMNKIDVGTPSSAATSKYNEWEMIEVHYHDFENLTKTMRDFVLSPEFTCFGHQWCLKLYPGGSNIKRKVAIYLEHLSSGGSIRIQFGLCVINKNRGWSGFVTEADGVEFSLSKTVSGRSNFCDRSDIISALEDGTLIIEVRMRNVAPSTSTPFIPENPFVKTILNMFNDEESADIMFEVGTQNESEENVHKRAKTTTSFYAHRNILQKGCSSTLLGELCKSGGEGGVTSISITDVNPEIFRHLLYYVYGGEISDEELANNAKDILDAADKYEVVNLKLEAEASYVESTSIKFENAIDCLLYADSKNCALLKEAVMDFLVENRKEGTTKLSFKNVPGHVIPDLLTAVNRDYDKGSPTSTYANDLSTIRVSTLRSMLHEKGLDIDGSREMMIARLEACISS